LKRSFDQAVAWAGQHGIPHSRLFLGEFGAIKQDAAEVPARLESRAALISAIRHQAEGLGIGWSVWVYGGSFGITTDDTSRKLEPRILTALGLQSR
jgi:endoglucanase